MNMPPDLPKWNSPLGILVDTVFGFVVILILGIIIVSVIGLIYIFSSLYESGITGRGVALILGILLISWVVGRITGWKQ